jgi:SEC-C motif
MKTQKPGRNDPCPCGSGLKYKKCCGSVLRESNREEIATQGLPPTATTATVPLMGLPGEQQQVHLVNQFKGDDPRNRTPFGGSPGEYVVTFVLGRPGFSLLPEGSLSFANGLRGDSHLAITKPAFTPPDPDATNIIVFARTEDGDFQFSGHPNDKGLLGKFVSVPFRADNRNDAEHKAFRALATALSNWSAHLDIPLEIVQRETMEVATCNIQTTIVPPYLEAPFAVAPTDNTSNEYRGYVSLYREALSSSSTVYRFLCFYKIIEGLRARRKRLERAAYRSGASYSPPVEVFPATPGEVVNWLSALFPVHREWDAMSIESAVPPDVRGRDVQEFATSTLRHLRDNIAHALTEASGELTVSADELLDIQQVHRWLPVTKCIVRRMLKNDFPAEFLHYLGEDGKVHAPA